MPFCNKINQSTFKVEVVIICWELDTLIRNSDVFTFLPTCPVARNTVTWPAKKVTLKLLYNLIAFGPIKWHSIRQRLFGCVAPYAAKVASPAFLHPRFFLSFPLREKPFSEIREKHYQMKTVKVVSALSPTLSLSLSLSVSLSQCPPLSSLSLSLLFLCKFFFSSSKAVLVAVVRQLSQIMFYYVSILVSAWLHSFFILSLHLLISSSFLKMSFIHFLYTFSHSFCYHFYISVLSFSECCLSSFSFLSFSASATENISLWYNIT